MFTANLVVQVIQLVCSSIHSHFTITISQDLKVDLSARANDLVHYCYMFKAKDIVVIIN